MSSSPNTRFEGFSGLVDDKKPSPWKHSEWCGRGTCYLCDVIYWRIVCGVIIAAVVFDITVIVLVLSYH